MNPCFLVHSAAHGVDKNSIFFLDEVWRDVGVRMCWPVALVMFYTGGKWSTIVP